MTNTLAENWVMCSFFNSKPDPQRNIIWEADSSKLLPLITSVVNAGVKIKVFHDCFDAPPNIKGCEWCRVPPSTDYALTVYRWFNYLEYLENSTTLPDFLFMVDSTDVEMLQYPFNDMCKGVIYTGSEHNNIVGCEYLRKRERYFNIEDYRDVLLLSAQAPLLNAGICGADTYTIIDFLKKLTATHSEQSKGITATLDMPIYNYTILKYFKNYISGSCVNTAYKRYETNNISWWKHK